MDFTVLVWFAELYIHGSTNELLTFLLINALFNVYTIASKSALDFMGFHANKSVIFDLFNSFPS